MLYVEYSYFNCITLEENLEDIIKKSANIFTLCLVTEDVNTYPRVQPMFKIPIIKEFYIGDTLQTLKYELGADRAVKNCRRRHYC
jgi:hypothetical protein